MPTSAWTRYHSRPHRSQHPRVRVGVAFVGRVQARGVAVEAVCVLHDELAGPQHAGAGTRLVAFLDLEVVEDQRQVAVGLDGRGDVTGDDLLMGHGQHHVGPAPVLELEQLVDLIASGLAPRLGGMQDRHQHLLSTDRVHLLAHDLHDPLMHTPARRQPGPQARADLTDQPRPDHQLVGDGFRIGGRLALGG